MALNGKVEAIALEYVIKCASISEIARKFGVMHSSVKKVVKQLNLEEKRSKYQKEVLSKAIQKCSEKQSDIISRSTDILNIHVKKLQDRQRKLTGDKTLTNNDIRDILAIISIIAKEHRLDNNKATEIVDNVNVVMPETFFPILNKDLSKIENKQMPKEDPNEIIVEEEIIKEEPPENYELGQEEKVEVKVHSETLGSPLG